MTTKAFVVGAPGFSDLRFEIQILSAGNGVEYPVSLWVFGDRRSRDQFLSFIKGWGAPRGQALKITHGRSRTNRTEVKFASFDICQMVELAARLLGLEKLIIGDWVGLQREKQIAFLNHVVALLLEMVEPLMRFRELKEAHDQIKKSRRSLRKYDGT